MIRMMPARKRAPSLGAVLAGVMPASAADIFRHSVPADHSCLFASVAYLCQGISGEVELRTAGRKLREVCAQAVLADPDPASRAIMLGHDSVEAYVQWIRNETHWGGEPEVLMLAEHFETELVVSRAVAQRPALCRGRQERHQCCSNPNPNPNPNPRP